MSVRPQKILGLHQRYGDNNNAVGVPLLSPTADCNDSLLPLIQPRCHSRIRKGERLIVGTTAGFWFGRRDGLLASGTFVFGSRFYVSTVGSAGNVLGAFNFQ